MKVLANTMHKFNTFIREHPNLSPVILPLRDGLTIIRYDTQNPL